MVPGGTSIGALALAHAGVHKIVELHEERQAEPDHPAPHTVVVIRDPREVPPSTLRTAALSPADAFPPADFPELAANIDNPALFDGVDLVLATSGSTGHPRWVGLSIEALLESARLTAQRLAGPGRWILALPTHHVAGAMVLLRAVASGFPPQIVDCSSGFDPQRLLPAVRGATQDPEVPSYLSLVPTQLLACLRAGDEVTTALASLSAVLIGGAAVDPGLVKRAEGAGIRIVRTYGMTETCGGCVYDGVALDDLNMTIDTDSHISLSGPVLFTRYLDEGPQVDHRDQTLRTHDLGIIEDGRLEVLGRADSIINTGGIKVSPGPVEQILRIQGGVRDALVFPLPDEKWGQIVATAVEIEPSTASAVASTAFAQRLFETVTEALGKEHAPRVIALTRTFPRFDSGKTDRQSLITLTMSARDATTGRSANNANANPDLGDDVKDENGVFLWQR